MRHLLPYYIFGRCWTQLFLREDDGRFSLMADGSLVIERVASDDEGEYVCEAQSPAGSAFAKTKLDVRGKNSKAE